MNKLIILLFSILLIGCSKPAEIECQNITINNTIETIKYINITTIEKCNLTSPKERELELIRRIKFLEKYQDELIMNETECNQTIYKGKLEMCERDMEEVEDELEDCEEELCVYNSSWC